MAERVSDGDAGGGGEAMPDAWTGVCVGVLGGFGGFACMFCQGVGGLSSGGLGEEGIGDGGRC